MKKIIKEDTFYLIQTGEYGSFYQRSRVVKATDSPLTYGEETIINLCEYILKQDINNEVGE